MRGRPRDVEIGIIPAEVGNGVTISICHPMVGDGRAIRSSVELLFDQVVRHDQYGISGDLTRGDVVIDVGASIGLFTWMAASQGARVYAFEPNPKEFPFLKAFVEINHLSAEPVMMVVGDISGTVSFDCGYLQTLGDGQVMTDDMEMRHVPESIGCPIDVESTTLDEFRGRRNLSRLDVVKVDTEGHEAKVLLGAIDTIRELHPRILLASYHRMDDERILSDLVRSIEPSYSFQLVPASPPHTDPLLVCLP